MKLVIFFELDEVIGRADRLMYEVKDENKNALRWDVVGV